MCTNIRYGYTRSRLISTLYSERLLVPIKCGHCAECEAERKYEYMYRIFHEWQDTCENHGYVLFQRLSYCDQELPHVSDYMDLPPGVTDFPCFSRDHIRKFFVRLRRKLSYSGYDVAGNLKYYLAAEYGSDKEYISDSGHLRRATNRPHYHILLFCKSSIPVEILNQMVCDCWPYGKIDNLRKFGNRSNYFPAADLARILRVSHYVSLYVQKNCQFRNEITKRIATVMESFAKDRDHSVKLKTSEIADYIPKDNIYDRYYLPRRVVSYDEISNYSAWLDSLEACQLRSSLFRCVDQFHLQSKGFGECALRDIDINSLMSNGLVTMPDQRNIVRSLPLPLYYRRKLFYDLILLENGQRVWQINSLGRLFRQTCNKIAFDSLTKRFDIFFQQHNISNVIPSDLARYVVYKRGRVNNAISYEPSFTEKLNTPNIFYNYPTKLDKHLYGNNIVSAYYLGSATCDGLWYYVDLKPFNPISLKSFVYSHGYFDPVYEDVLHKIDACEVFGSIGKDNAFYHIQRLRNLYTM